MSDLQNVLTEVDRLRGPMTQYLQRLVQIPSLPGGEQAAQHFLAAKLESLNDYLEQRLPVYLIEEDNGRRLIYGFPLTGPPAEGVKVALHGSDDVCTPGSAHRGLLPEDENAIRTRLAETIPGLGGRLIHAETCLYTMTPDEHFLLGAHPDYSNVAIAAGFSGHGFKFAQVIGEMLADLVAGKTAAVPELFSLGRFA